MSILASLRPEDHVICVSEATKRDLCEYLPAIDPARVFVAYNAASPEVFHPVRDPEEVAGVRRKYGIPEDGQYVLSLNTLSPRKNTEHAVRSFARLVEQECLKDLYLVLAGERGWDYGPVFDAVAGCRAARERVVVTGYVPDADLAALYSGCLFFVFPSLYEGFGLPPLEAMQCGVPVITSNTSSLPEVVGDDGIMVDPRDPEALAQAMLELYDNPDRRRELSERALRRARTFTWERCARETVAAYRAALGAA